MKITASIISAQHQHDVVVDTDGNAKTLTVPYKASGYGSAINGGEMLLLSLATCFCNDIYREAATRNITVKGVSVEFTGTFGGVGDPGSDFSYTVAIDSDAPQNEIDELITHTDHIAEVHRTLRKGLDIKLVR